MNGFIPRNVSAWLTPGSTDLNWSNSGGSFSLGNGTETHRYRRLGNSIEFWSYLICGTTTSLGGPGSIQLSFALDSGIAGQDIQFDFPTTSPAMTSAQGYNLGECTIHKNGVAIWPARIRVSSPTTVAFVLFNTAGTYATQSSGEWVTQAVPGAVANNMEFFAHGILPVKQWQP